MHIEKCFSNLFLWSPSCLNTYSVTNLLAPTRHHASWNFLMSKFEKRETSLSSPTLLAWGGLGDQEIKWERKTDPRICMAEAMKNFYLSRAHWSLKSGQAVIKGTQNADHGIRDALTLPHTFPHKLCPGSQRLDFARHPHFQTPLSSSPLPPFCSSVAQCNQYNHPLCLCLL
jgi:hypothetical protein